MNVRFDATELGLLAKHEFTAQPEGYAEREKGDTYVFISKDNSTTFTVKKEQGNSVKVALYHTLRKALQHL